MKTYHFPILATVTIILIGLVLISSCCNDPVDPDPICTEGYEFDGDTCVCNGIMHQGEFGDGCLALGDSIYRLVRIEGFGEDCFSNIVALELREGLSESFADSNYTYISYYATDHFKRPLVFHDSLDVHCRATLNRQQWKFRFPGCMPEYDLEPLVYDRVLCIYEDSARLTFNFYENGGNIDLGVSSSWLYEATR